MGGLLPQEVDILSDPEAWIKVEERLGELLNGQTCTADNILTELETDGHLSMPFRLACASYLVSLHPELSSRILSFWRAGFKTIASPPGSRKGRVLGELLSRLSNRLPETLRMIYKGGPDILMAWNELLQTLEMVREELLAPERPPPAVAIRGARLLQLMVLGMTWSLRVEGDEDGEEDCTDELVTLQQLSKDGQLKPSAVREAAHRLLDALIMLLWRGNAALGSQLAIINLLGRTAKRRPHFLAKIIPALIDLYEGLSGGGRGELKEHQKTFLENTLERQLAGIVEMPAAEKFYPLIVEALKKFSSGRAKRKRAVSEEKGTLSGGPVVEEEEDDAMLAAVGTKRMKIDPAVVELRVEKLAFHHVAQVLVTALRSTSMDQVRKAIEKWRPTPQVRDPRRAPTEVPADVNKVDQAVPFELVPRELDSREYVQVSLNRFKCLLEGFSDATLLRDKQRRKRLTRSLLRLALLIQNLSSASSEPSSSIMSDLIVAFCFENVKERMSILQYWLRILWINSSGERLEDAKTLQDLYETCYSVAVESLQQLVVENSTQWATPVQKFFQEAPLLCSDVHVKILDWICTTSETRMAGLVIVEHLIVNRPAIQCELFESLLMRYCQSPDESLRKAAISIAADNLSKSSQYYPILKDHSIELLKSHHDDSANTDDDAVYRVDLPLRLACGNVDFFKVFLSEFEAQSMPVKEHLINQVPMIVTIISPECCEYLVQQPALGSVQLFLEKIIEGLINSKLISGTWIGLAFDSIGKGLLPVRILEALIVCASSENIDSLKAALHAYILQVDPAVEANKAAYANLLAKAAEIIGPSDFFVHLHCLEASVPLKRLVDVIQFCFLLTIVFKPDILAAGLTQLAQLPTLSTMLLRSILQSVSTHRNLTSTAVGLLSKLIERSIWEYPKLWDGLIRCLRQLAPASHAVMLQLPVERLEEVLLAVPELKLSFHAYLRQQSKPVQARFPDSLFR